MVEIFVSTANFFLDSEREVNSTSTRALDLALRYGFVTELTSLIVVADDNFTLDESEPSGELGRESVFADGAPFPSSPDLTICKPGIYKYNLRTSLNTLKND